MTGMRHDRATAHCTWPIEVRLHTHPWSVRGVIAARDRTGSSPVRLLIVPPPERYPDDLLPTGQPQDHTEYLGGIPGKLRISRSGSVQHHTELMQPAAPPP